MDMTITREEALKRLKATKKAKQQRIEILKKRMCEKCKANTGEKPQLLYLYDSSTFIG